jgi:hypothetical protein
MRQTLATEHSSSWRWPTVKRVSVGMTPNLSCIGRRTLLLMAQGLLLVWPT